MVLRPFFAVLALAATVAALVGVALPGVPTVPFLITPFCQLRGVLQQALDAFLAELDRHTLADLLPPDARSGLTQQLFAV